MHSIERIAERAILRAFFVWLYNRGGQDHSRLHEAFLLVDLYLQEMYNGRRIVRDPR